MQATLLQGSSQGVLNLICTDSRKQIIPNTTLFFALKTTKNDGHNYLENLYQRGVRHFVINKKNINLPEDCTLFYVENSLTALQLLAQKYRSEFDIPVVGITGSNGKTIVKEWAATLLQNSSICKSPKSYNSQLGVPYSVLLLEPIHQLAIFEAGISMKGEMLKLYEIIKPTIGVVTSIGSAHDEGFENIIEKWAEKIILFSSCKYVIAPAEAWLGDTNQSYQLRLWSFNMENNPYFFLTKIAVKTYSIFYETTTLTFEIPFDDHISIHNTITALCLALSVVEHESEEAKQEIILQIKQLQSLELRLQIEDGINNCTIINDTYSNDLDALRLALDVLKNQTQHSKHSLILSEIDTGHKEEYSKMLALSNLINTVILNKIHLIGKGFMQYKSMFDARVQLYETSLDFINSSAIAQFDNESILIKGARKFQLETISNILIKKSHGTYLEVNLDALLHNYSVYKNRIAPTTKIMVMVKAISYGMGVYEVAMALEQQLDYLAVAYIDEAIDLRLRNITTPILVLNADEEHCYTFTKHDLDIEIYDLQQLKKIVERCDFLKLAYPKVQLKIETGMHRLGLEQEALPGIIAIVVEKKIKVTAILSHLAASSNNEHRVFTQHQIDIFLNSCQTIESKIGYKVLKHILNTGGITNFASAQFDMVRLGIGLYGSDSNIEIKNELRPVARLITYILQIKNVAADQTVGYNRVGKIEKPTRIATVAMGYADGLPRSLSNGKGVMYLHGKACKIIGNVCMDMTMIDITEVDNAVTGDEVELFGKWQHVESVAAHAGTISYEILSGISARVKRVYIKET